jgi:hypothetical protein
MTGDRRVSAFLAFPRTISAPKLLSVEGMNVELADMEYVKVEGLASNWFNPQLDEQRLAFPGAVQKVLGEASSRGMVYSGSTYGVVENLAQSEVEQRGRIMLDGYKKALSATTGVVPEDATTQIKNALRKTLHGEANQVHSSIQYVRDAIKPSRTKSADDLVARPLQKLLAEFDLFWAQLKTDRGVPTFGWKPSSVQMRRVASYDQGPHNVFLSWVKRHSWFATIGGFAVLTAPQWVASVWALFSNEPLIPWLIKHHIPHFSFSAWWITAPLGIAMLTAVWWLRSRKKPLIRNSVSAALPKDQETNEPSGA